MNSIYKVKFEKEAAKYIKRLDKVRRKQIQQIIKRLQVNPFIASGVKRLKGSHHDEYRIRFGDFRLLYRIEHDRLVVIIIKIGPRGDIYK